MPNPKKKYNKAIKALDKRKKELKRLQQRKLENIIMEAASQSAGQNISRKQAAKAVAQLDKSTSIKDFREAAKPLNEQIDALESQLSKCTQELANTHAEVIAMDDIMEQKILPFAIHTYTAMSSKEIFETLLEYFELLRSEPIKLINLFCLKKYGLESDTLPSLDGLSTDELMSLKSLYSMKSEEKIRLLDKVDSRKNDVEAILKDEIINPLVLEYLKQLTQEHQINYNIKDKDIQEILKDIDNWPKSERHLDPINIILLTKSSKDIFWYLLNTRKKETSIPYDIIDKLHCENNTLLLSSIILTIESEIIKKEVIELSSGLNIDTEKLLPNKLTDSEKKFLSHIEKNPFCNEILASIALTIKWYINTPYVTIYNFDKPLRNKYDNTDSFDKAVQKFSASMTEALAPIDPEAPSSRASIEIIKAAKSMAFVVQKLSGDENNINIGLSKKLKETDISTELPISSAGDVIIFEGRHTSLSAPNKSLALAMALARFIIIRILFNRNITKENFFELLLSAYSTCDNLQNLS